MIGLTPAIRILLEPEKARFLIDVLFKNCLDLYRGLESILRRMWNGLGENIGCESGLLDLRRQTEDV